MSVPSFAYTRVLDLLAEDGCVVFMRVKLKCAHQVRPSLAEQRDTSYVSGDDARHDGWVFRKPVGAGVGLLGFRNGSIRPFTCPVDGVFK